MTAQQVSRYIELVDRRTFILTHSGVDWVPGYGAELDQIEKELAELRPLVEEEHKKRGTDK